MEFGLIAIVGILITIVAGILAAEMDSVFLAIATFIVATLTLDFGFGVGLWALISGNLLWLAVIIILYTAAAGLYITLWRWPEYIRDNGESIMNKYSHWARGQSGGADSSFDAFMESSEYRFKASMHKERIATWVAMWPFSMAWELTRKPTVWIWNTLYASLGGALERVGRNTARKIHDKQ